MNSAAQLSLLNTIHVGDAVETMNALPPGYVNLIITTLPLKTTGYRRPGNERDEHYTDEFILRVRDYMEACKRVLAPDGTMFLNTSSMDDLVDMVPVFRTMGWPPACRIWCPHLRDGQTTFYFTSSDKYTHNSTAVEYPSTWPGVNTLRYNNPFPSLPHNPETSPDIGLDPNHFRRSPLDSDWPEGLIAHLIRIFSNPGDLVLDPFVRSGVVPAAAVKLSRRYIGIDASDEVVQKARERVAQAEALRRQPADASGCTPLDVEMLEDLYRDLKIHASKRGGRPVYENGIRKLERHKKMMECFLQNLEKRTGRAHTAEEVVTKLLELKIGFTKGH